MNARALCLIGTYLTIVLTASCSAPPEWGGAGAACEAETDCFTGLDCHDGVCVEPGEQPADAGVDAAEDDDGGDGEDADGLPDGGADAGACGGACANPTPVCDVAAGTCVACLVAEDCDSGVCNPADNTCVECVASEDCATGVCDTGTNTCVGCLTDADCPEAGASACDTATNTCVGCSDSAQCGHVVGATVCDLADATCVECTGTEFAACNGVCDSRLNTCTELPAGQLGLCEACVSDAQCRTGMYCVPMMYDAADGSGSAEVGTFCLWDIDSTEPNGPAGACSTVRPYIAATNVETIDGQTRTVCSLDVSTCPALADFKEDCTAAGMDDECGAAGFDDGLCVTFDAASNKCTTICGGDDDCYDGFSCDDTVTPNRCRLTTN